MAQLDTGLGWSAKDTYLMSAGAALLAQFGGMTDPDHVFTGQPLPKNLSTDADVAAGGLTYAETTDYLWKVASTDNNQVFAFKYSYYFVGVSLGVQGTIRSVRIRKSTGAISRGENRTLGSTYSGTSFKYTTITTGTGNWEIPSSATWYIPVFSSLAEGIGHIGTVDQSFYKLNAGYAVACLVKMRYLDATMTAPVLISSVPEYAVISTDGATPDPDAGISSFLRDGMAFTMRIDLPIIGANLTTSSLQTVDMTTISNVDPRRIFGTIATAANITILTSDDPYGDPTLDNDGGDDTSDNPDPEDIDFSMPPYIAASDSGFVTLFNPTATELRDLASFMWSSGFDLDTLKRIYASPIDYIIGASIVPVIPSLKEANHPITLPGVAGAISTGVSMDAVYQYSTVNCGTMYIGKKHGAYLDYSPYSHYQIWLPYIGFRDVDADDITGKTIELQYLVDLLSGACNAELKCGGTVLYSWQGQCGAQIPINSADWSSMFSGAISLAASAVKLGASIATGGAGIASVATDVASIGMAATGMKPSITRGGTVAGAAGFMAAQKPYIVYTRPERAISAGQNEISGYPSFVTMTLGDLTGYNEIYRIHLENIPATETELAELDGILKGGVIF